MKAQLRKVSSEGVEYDCLAFCCPGCADWMGNDGLHMLPVNTSQHEPQWTFDGNLDAPTLEPSILTTTYRGEGEERVEMRCHSYLRGGVFEFLGDSTHALKEQHVPMPDLPDWFNQETQEQEDA